MGPLHHAVRNLHATLQAAREAIPDDRDIIDMRDWAYDLERTLDLLQTNTNRARESNVTAEKQTRLSTVVLTRGTDPRSRTCLGWHMQVY